jgi:hypothetical protein
VNRIELSPCYKNKWDHDWLQYWFYVDIRAPGCSVVGGSYSSFSGEISPLIVLLELAIWIDHSRTNVRGSSITQQWRTNAPTQAFPATNAAAARTACILAGYFIALLDSTLHSRITWPLKAVLYSTQPYTAGLHGL